MKRKAVYVEWRDSTGWDGWARLPQKSELSTHDLIVGIGFVEDDSGDMLALSGHISGETGLRHGLIKIPKEAIVKRKTLKL